MSKIEGVWGVLHGVSAGPRQRQCEDTGSGKVLRAMPALARRITAYLISNR